MSVRPPIDHEHLTLASTERLQQTGAHVHIDEGVSVIITQAFGPRGDSLMEGADVTFDGHPAVTLKVRCAAGEGLVHLSPFHGDRRKETDLQIPVGMRCELFCPVSGAPLDRVGVSEDGHTEYWAIYLTPRLSEGEMVAISGTWGDYHSRIVDNFELISSWAATEADFADA
jgi:hypothetical protein